MKHPAALPVSPDSAHAHASLDVDKGMALVFVDGQVKAIVHCYATLHAFCDWQMAEADPHPITVSLAFSFGDPCARVHSFTLSNAEWKSRGLEDEERFTTEFLPTIGVLCDDDQEPAPVGHA